MNGEREEGVRVLLMLTARWPCLALVESPHEKLRISNKTITKTQTCYNGNKNMVWVLRNGTFIMVAMQSI